MPVYLYACNLYCSDPNIGQRGVAESTRNKFNLKKFSHSTVSRSFKSFEQSRKQALEERFGDEYTVYDTKIENLVGAAVKNKSEKAAKKAKGFPSADETAVRRKRMTVFFQEFKDMSQIMTVEATSHQFAEKLHKKIRRLLL